MAPPLSNAPSNAPSPRKVCLRVLSDFGRGGIERIGAALDASPLQGRDAAFARELSYGVMRRRRLLDFVLEGFLPRGLPSDLRLLTALRIGAYELGFMRTPLHAAVNEAVGLIRGPKRGVVNAVLRRVAEAIDRSGENPDREALRDDRLRVPNGVVRLNAQLPADAAARAAIEFSLPDFLTTRWSRTHGAESMRRAAIASVAVPSTHLRATSLAGGKLSETLGEEGVETELVDPADESVLRVAAGKPPPIGGPAFARGAFVIQNRTSVLAGRAVGAVSGETVIDYCAAPGTKSVQLAEAVCADGRVFAFDPAESRRGRIVENVRRIGLTNIEVVESREALPARADRVLVDAPCSNTGVLARRVEVRERITESAIRALVAQQRMILASAAQHVRQGGSLVYSTCSIESDENEAVVKSLESRFELVTQQLTLPDPDGLFDGGYFAVLRCLSAK